MGVSRFLIFSLLSASLPSSFAVAANPTMDVKTFVERCKSKHEICAVALEMAIFGIANGATNAAKLAGSPQRARPYVQGPCNQLVGNWQIAELVDRFNVFASKWPVDQTAEAPYSIIIGTFALSKYCIPD